MGLWLLAGLLILGGLVAGRRRGWQLKQMHGLDAQLGAGGSAYRRHRPEVTALYGVVEQHAHAFFEGQEALGRGLPQLVREEFEAYLRYGRLEWGFIRAK
ncbi:MAG: hypothetical protein HOI95_15655, partial [Chromatiales bacterium]|nr:hypothetical protein [Chromatiales bacterium]